MGCLMTGYEFRRLTRAMQDYVWVQNIFTGHAMTGLNFHWSFDDWVWVPVTGTGHALNKHEFRSGASLYRFLIFSPLLTYIHWSYDEFDLSSKDCKGSCNDYAWLSRIMPWPGMIIKCHAMTWHECQRMAFVRRWQRMSWEDVTGHARTAHIYLS